VSRGAALRWDLTAAVVIVAVVGASLAVAGATGSLGIPHNDDWSYSRTALDFARTGQVNLYGWGQMFLVGQVVTTAPLLLITGAHQWALQVYGTLAAILVLVCTYLLAGRGWRAAALVAVVSIFPGFALWSASYMTDLPASAAALLALVLGARAVRRESVVWLVAALVAGLWAFTIRETMIVAIPAVVVTALVARRLRAVATIAGGVLIIGGVGLEHVRHGLANADAPPYQISNLQFTLPPTLVSSLLTLGLGVSPLVVWAALRLRTADLRNIGRWVGWVAGGLAVLYVRVPLTLPNHLDQRGAYWDAFVGGSVVVLGHRFWLVLQVLAAVGTILLLGEVGAALAERAWRRISAWDPARTAAVSFGVLLAGVMAGLSLIGQVQWDRYVLVLIPCVGVALLPTLQMPRRRALAVVPGAAVLLLGVVGWLLTVRAEVRDAAVWRAAEGLVAEGVDPRQINAGLDWAGYHSPGPAVKGGEPTRLAYHGQRWLGVFSGSGDCWLVSLTPLPAVGATMSTVDGVYVLHRPSC
jgi:hypothetical protein